MPLFHTHLASLAKQYPDCPHCGRDLAGLVEKAVFCPGCGSRLRDKITPRDRVLAQASAALHLISFGKLGSPIKTAESTVAAGVCCTPILVGYSRALFTLGFRYERGQGASRNLPEAIRCYRKSARLGNIDAMVRLAPADAASPVPVVPIVR